MRILSLAIIFGSTIVMNGCGGDKKDSTVQPLNKVVGKEKADEEDDEAADGGDGLEGSKNVDQQELGIKMKSPVSGGTPKQSPIVNINSQVGVRGARTGDQGSTSNSQVNGGGGAPDGGADAPSRQQRTRTSNTPVGARGGASGGVAESQQQTSASNTPVGARGGAPADGPIQPTRTTNSRVGGAPTEDQGPTSNSQGGVRGGAPAGGADAASQQTRTTNSRVGGDSSSPNTGRVIPPVNNQVRNPRPNGAQPDPTQAANGRLPPGLGEELLGAIARRQRQQQRIEEEQQQAELNAQIDTNH